MKVHKEMETRIAVLKIYSIIEALRSYERISEEQHRAVSKVIMTNTEYEGAHSGLRTEIQCQENRSVQYNAGTTESLGRLFGDLTNCTIGSLTVNVSLVPRLLVGGEKRAWYPLFAHALNHPLLSTCSGNSGRGTRNTYPCDL